MEPTTAKHRIMRKGNTSQKDRLADKINQLKQDITAADREACLTSCDISEPTLKRYLSGNIGNSDKAVELIEFFKGRIAKREAVIAA